MGKRYFQHRLASGLVLLLVLSAMPLHAEEPKEGLVKAAFIHKFSMFTEWPEGKSTKGKHPEIIDICVLGDSIISKMQQVFEKASTPEKKYTLVKKSSWQQASQDCHVLFISQSEAKRLDGILEGLNGNAVLTVSDIPGFAEKGGMIEFSLVDNKLKVGTINNSAASKSGIHIGSELLEVALQVIGG